MKRRDLLNALICALLLTGGLAAVLFSSGALRAQTDSDSDYADSSPRRCRSCHADIYTAWADSQHALTFDSEVFQQVWERARQSPDCLTCHNPLAETTHATGVGCGACHHTIDTTRRQAEGSSTTYHGQMGTLASAADCGTCHGADHALTYVEWEASAHNGARTVDCLSCHQSHTGGLTAAAARAVWKLSPAGCADNQPTYAR